MVSNPYKAKMNRSACLVAILSLLVGLLPVGAEPAAPWSTIVIGAQSEPERLATADLQRYLAQATGRVPAVTSVAQWQKQPVPAVFIGTPAANPALDGQDLGAAAGKPEGFLLASATVKQQPVVIVAGADSAGAVQGVYGLLRELGFGFFLGSETVPSSLPARLPTGRVVKAPALGIRGVLPWYNFFNSPTTWDPVDHRTFVDQLVRCGANFVGFHTYEGEPFAGIIKGDKVIGGSRLLSTATRTWGTVPTKTADFGFGIGNLYAQEYFGAATTELPGPVTEVVKCEQDILRDALNYAKARDLKPCIGFEIRRNPMNPQETEGFLAQFNHVLVQYPGAEYIWLWQPETQGAKGYDRTDRGKDGAAFDALCNFGLERREIFKRVVDEAEGIPPFFEKTEEGRINRAMEGARLEQYAMLAWRALQRREHAPRLVISGWGGDRRLLSAEYYAGLDQVLPKDVVFSSLDLIGPIRRVDKVYGALSSDRQRWPIPWLENDGDQWMPQPYVDIYQDLMKDLISGGSQGVLGIHWRTRCIEENFQFLVDCAWNPGLRAEEFYADFARRRYGTAIAQPMAQVHRRLDQLPYRWIGGVGQVECGEFTWGKVGNQADEETLKGLAKTCVELLPNAGAGTEQLHWLINRMEYALAYREAQADYLSAEAEADTHPQTALDILDRGVLAKALHTYSRCLKTAANTASWLPYSKAVFSWNTLRKRCVGTLGGDHPDPNATWNPQPGVLVPRLIGSAIVGQDLPVELVILGGGSGYLHYRPLGSTAWKTLPMQTVRRWVRRATVPASDVAVPGLELAVSLDGMPERGFAWGPRGVTVMPGSTLFGASLVKAEKPLTNAIPLTIGTGRGAPIALQWGDMAGVDAFRIYRDDCLLASTSVAGFQDIPDREHGTYRIEAIRDGAVVASSKPTDYVLPDTPVNENPSFTITPNNLGILITAAPIKSTAVLKYRLYRSGTASVISTGPQDKIFEHLGVKESETEGEQLLAEVTASQTSPTRYFDLVAPGTWRYRMELASLTGRTNQESVPQSIVFRRDSVQAFLELPLTTSLPEKAVASGEVACAPQGLKVQQGYLDLPHNDAMNLGRSLTVQFGFSLEDRGIMPVVFSHGVFKRDGWFIQILGGRLSLCLPGCRLAIIVLDCCLSCKYTTT